VVGQTRYKTTGFANSDVIVDDDGNQIYCGGCSGSFQLGFGNTGFTSGGGIYGAGFTVYFNSGFRG